jgi:Zn2+/Cd2+-exporting ATPase
MSVARSKLPTPIYIVRLLKENPELLAASICSVLVLLGWLMLNLNWIGLSVAILCAAYVIGGYESAREGLTTLVREKELDVDLLMIVAALGAAGLGFWRQEYNLIVDGAVLILIFAISDALEGVAMQRTERSIRGLMSLTADTARIIRGNREQMIPIEQLQVGDKILVKPGELIPTDSIILEGKSTLNEASITGESMPVEKRAGNEVFAGTLNGNGALWLKVDRPPESSLIQRIIQLVKQAQTEAPPSQQFIERFERSYAKAIVIIGIFWAVLPPFLWGWDWETTIYKVLIFLVVASPCALMAAIMPTLLSGIANGARQGILFKSSATLEALGQVKAIAFDKTGTLTTGQLQVTQLIPATGISESYLLTIAATLEAYSEHPIGEAIVRIAQQRNLLKLEAGDVRAEAGQGIEGIIAGKRVWVGKLVGLKANTLSLANLLPTCRSLEEKGNTLVWVIQAEQVLGAIAVADKVRPEAQGAISQLKKLGIKQIIMLTGDNERTAHQIAQTVGIDRVYAELLPEDKIHILRRLQQQYRTVAMVGDGINDAPALAQASVGIAMGVTGTDVALETADVVLMADRLDRLEQAIRLGRRAQRIVKQNIIFAIAFIILLLTANFVGGITLPIGVIGHEGSTLVVTLSGLRLLRG